MKKMNCWMGLFSVSLTLGLGLAGCAELPAAEADRGDAHTVIDEPMREVGEVDEPVQAAARRTIELLIDQSVLNYDLFLAADSPTDPVNVIVTIVPNVIVGSLSPDHPALTTGQFAAGSRMTIRNRGAIIGAGGAGGSGGNGGSGGSPPGFQRCGRSGQDGGTALELMMDVKLVMNQGYIYGGGGGGGGLSACNETAGGGGGAGSFGGFGGAGATSLSELDELDFCGQDNGYRVGPVGETGSLFGYGTGGKINSPWSNAAAGDGGGFGRPGKQSRECIGSMGSPGGAAGAAIERNGHVLDGVADGDYASGGGFIRGPVR